MVGLSEDQYMKKSNLLEVIVAEFNQSLHNFDFEAKATTCYFLKKNDFSMNAAWNPLNF